MNDSPLLLQRGCRVEYRLRSSIAVDEEHPGGNPEFDAAVARARLTLDNGGAGSRAWVDLVCCYDTHALNEEATVHARGARADKGEKRIATWEVFPTDVVLCPAGQRRLDPRMYELAVAAVEGAAA